MPLLEEVQLFFTDHQQKSTAPTLKDCSRLLRLEANRYRKVYVVIDALDEGLEDPNPTVLKELKALQGVVSLLITSRLHIKPQEKFPGALYVQVRVAEEDIRAYISDRLTGHPCVEKQPQLQKEIEDSVVTRSEGLYVFIKCIFFNH